MSHFLEVVFLSSQKPLAASMRVLANSQNNFQLLHGYDKPNLSFKQRRVNKPSTIISRLIEYTNSFFSTYPIVVFSHLSQQPLLPCTRRHQCLTTATIRSFGYFENFSCHFCRIVKWHLLAANSKSVEIF